MNGKKAKMLRKNLDVKAVFPTHYTIKVSSMSHPLFPAASVVNPIRLIPNHPRAGYRAAKRIYKNRSLMEQFFSRVI